MGNRPNLVSDFYTILKGDTVRVFLYGGDVVEDGNKISGITIRIQTPKGEVLAKGVTLTKAKDQYLIESKKLTELHRELVKINKSVEKKEFDAFIEDVYRAIKRKTATDFIKK